MRTLRLTALIAGLATAALVSAGCSSSTTGTANPAGAKSGGDAAGAAFDLCSALTVADLKDYVRSELPVSVRKSIQSNPYSDGGTADCEYGTFKAVGLTLSVPLGAAAPDIADLAKSAYSASGKDITVGSDNAYLTSSEFESVLAVQHGDTQFILKWRPLREAPDEGVTPAQMTSLAAKVAQKLPTAVNLTKRDVPKQCDNLQGVDDIVGGVTYARGSADEDNLVCDFAGPKGILSATALKWDDHVIESSLKAQRTVSPEQEVKPPVAQDTILFAPGQRDGLQLDGYLRMCCEFKVTYQTDESDNARGKDFDATERSFVTGFASAARTWA